VHAIFLCAGLETRNGKDWEKTKGGLRTTGFRLESGTPGEQWRVVSWQHILKKRRSFGRGTGKKRQHNRNHQYVPGSVGTEKDSGSWVSAIRESATLMFWFDRRNGGGKKNPAKGKGENSRWGGKESGKFQ